ncbi:hypothetical protein BKP35_01405 [Anaerobacillus arseniciselenatis]|uniref:Uncharacterized protein n=1 Tax=Anaerobacillus arseniciselenatis TaxID=85682 RepID=A0A1S2LTZ5_9BACI|nr:hypothetical protein [Anaerobacillus arseniciselenatis]OIJ15680.1 hypothetical protein BKP35_01405 [Anaerobacillus arseniciselenatis]
MNRFAYYSEDPEQVEEYVKSILPFISDIREFELYYIDKTPYIEVIERSGHLHRRVFYSRKEFDASIKNSYRKLIKQHNFTFILRDDTLNEVWLNTNGKMIETLNILHMLGIKEFHHYRHKASYKATNLKPNHDLNILVENDAAKKQFLAKFRFPYACKRIKAVEYIQQFGYLKPYATKFDYGNDLSYFDKNTIREAEAFEYATNNSFLFEDEGIDLNTAKRIFEEVGKLSGGDVNIVLFSD